MYLSAARVTFFCKVQELRNYVGTFELIIPQYKAYMQENVDRIDKY